MVNSRGDVVALFDSTGKELARYNYDAWGNCTVTTPTGTVITDMNHIANVNPLRYRGYYLDTDTGLYYLQSRYYDPQTCRFINADGIIGANGDMLAYNLFAYCSNNPVNAVDPTGQFSLIIAGIVALVAGVIGWIAGSAQIATNAINSRPKPKPDRLVVPNPYPNYYPSTPSLPKAQDRDKSDSKSKAIPKQPSKKSDTVIYRYGGTNPGNLTPRPKDLVPPVRGLSFSTTPQPGAAMTTINTLNATGVVRAVQDGQTHVSVYPVGGTMNDWVNAGSSSIWTAAVKSAVVKWDGGN